MFVTYIFCFIHYLYDMMIFKKINKGGEQILELIEYNPLNPYHWLGYLHLKTKVNTGS